MASNAAGHVVLTLRVTEEDGQWVSVCDQLDVASCGDTIQEAFDNATEAVYEYLNTLEEEGECERVFSERGIRIHSNEDLERDDVVAFNGRPSEYWSAKRVLIPAGV